MFTYPNGPENLPVCVTFVIICHAESRAHRGSAVSETRNDQKGVRRREDSAEAGSIARGTPSVLHRVADCEAVGEHETVWSLHKY